MRFRACVLDYLRAFSSEVGTTSRHENATKLDARPQEAIRTADDQRYRIWRVYLAAMAYAFDRGWLSVAQVPAYKPIPDGIAPRPQTRDYQYVDGDAAKSRAD